MSFVRGFLIFIVCSLFAGFVLASEAKDPKGFWIFLVPVMTMLVTPLFFLIHAISLPLLAISFRLRAGAPLFFSFSAACFGFLAIYFFSNLYGWLFPHIAQPFEGRMGLIILISAIGGAVFGSTAMAPRQRKKQIQLAPSAKYKDISQLKRRYEVRYPPDEKKS